MRNKKQNTLENVKYIISKLNEFDIPINLRKCVRGPHVEKVNKMMYMK